MLLVEWDCVNSLEWRKRIEIGFVIKANDTLCDIMPKPRKLKKRFGSTKSGIFVA